MKVTTCRLYKELNNCKLLLLGDQQVKGQGGKEIVAQLQHDRLPDGHRLRQHGRIELTPVLVDEVQYDVICVYEDYYIV